MKLKLSDRKLQILAWTITLVGILIGLGDLLGWFQSKERKDFYRLVLSSQSSVNLRSHPALKDFEKSFSPPNDFDEYDISKFTLQTAHGFPLQGTIQYRNKKDGKVHDAASFEDIRLWAEETIYGWIALGVIVLGWFIQIPQIFFKRKGE